MERRARLGLLGYALAIAVAPAAAAADRDPIARFLGHYHASSNAADPALPGLAVLRNAPIDLLIDRNVGDIVLHLSGVVQAELVYADGASPFHLIEAAGADAAEVRGYLRIGTDAAMAHSSRIGPDGAQDHLRLMIYRIDDGLRLIVLASRGAKPLSVVTDRRLHLVPGG